MPKTSKSDPKFVIRAEALTGMFKVLKPPFKSKRFTAKQLREAVRQVNEEQAAKGK